jgi:hypothetical protein
MKRRFIFQCLLCFVFSISAYAEPILFNRVILKVNETAYTQRQLEIYELVKSLHTSSSPLLASAENWKSLLMMFKEDLLVYEEASKLRYASHPSFNAADERQRLKKIIEGDKKLSDLADRLSLSDADYDKTLLMIHKIVSYKEKQEVNPLDVSGIPPDRRVPYLERRVYVRFYEGAFEYRFIQPYRAL